MANYFGCPAALWPGGGPTRQATQRFTFIVASAWYGLVLACSWCGVGYEGKVGLFLEDERAALGSGKDVGGKVLVG